MAHGQCAQRAIGEVKQRWSVTKNLLLKRNSILRTSEGASSCYSQLCLQLLEPTIHTGPAWWVMARSPYV
jgi:hypothetical protein